MLIEMATVPNPNLRNKELGKRLGFPPNPSQANQQARTKLLKDLGNSISCMMRWWFFMFVTREA
jgi:hypothetical protein